VNHAVSQCPVPGRFSFFGVRGDQTVILRQKQAEKTGFKPFMVKKCGIWVANFEKSFYNREDRQRRGKKP
jgi:hypothetical protein